MMRTAWKEPTVIRITRPTAVAHIRIENEQAIIVDVLDHDGTLLTTMSKRAWSSAGVATVDIATTPRPVQMVDGRPSVKLFFAELSGMRIRHESMRWLGIP